MEQETLGGGCEQVEELSMLGGLILGNCRDQYNGKGKSFYLCMIKGVCIKAPHSHKRLGVSKEN